MVIIGLIFSIISCNKDIQKETVKSQQSVNHLKFGYSNPLEFMGISHNNALDYIANAPGFPNLTTWQLYCLSCNYQDEYFDATNTSENEYDMLQSVIPDLVDAGKDAPYICYQAGLIGWQTKLRLDTLCNIIYQGYDNHELITPDDMDDLILEYEVSFIDENKTAEDYLDEHNFDGIILGACVISRYSYRYWYNAVHEQTSWTSYLEENGGLNYECFWKKAWADIMGFFHGCGVAHDQYCNPIPPSTLPFHHWAWDPVCSWNQAKEASASVNCE